MDKDIRRAGIEAMMDADAQEDWGCEFFPIATLTFEVDGDPFYSNPTPSRIIWNTGVIDAGYVVLEDEEQREEMPH